MQKWSLLVFAVVAAFGGSHASDAPRGDYTAAEIEQLRLATPERIRRELRELTAVLSADRPPCGTEIERMISHGRAAIPWALELIDTARSYPRLAGLHALEGVGDARVLDLLIQRADPLPKIYRNQLWMTIHQLDPARSLSEALTRLSRGDPVPEFDSILFGAKDTAFSEYAAAFLLTHPELNAKGRANLAILMGHAGDPDTIGLLAADLDRVVRNDPAARTYQHLVVDALLRFEAGLAGHHRLLAALPEFVRDLAADRELHGDRLMPARSAVSYGNEIDAILEKVFGPLSSRVYGRSFFQESLETSRQLFLAAGTVPSPLYSIPGFDDSPQPRFDELFLYDERKGAFHLADSRHNRFTWSPSGDRLLLYMRYATNRSRTEPRWTLRSLDFVNSSVVLIVIDVESRSLTPLMLPFGFERAPGGIDWWDDDSIFFVGEVVDGMLANQHLWPSKQRVLTRWSLTDRAHESLPIPSEVLRDEGAIGVEFSARVHRDHESGRIGVSFSRSQAGGGGRGWLIFEPDGSGATVVDKFEDAFTVAPLPDHCYACVAAANGRIARLRPGGRSRRVDGRSVYQTGPDGYLYILDPPAEPTSSSARR